MPGARGIEIPKADGFESVTGKGVKGQIDAKLVALGNQAGVTLVKGDLRSISRAMTLSRPTMRNIKQSLFFAFVYNAAGVPIAAGVLYPVFGLLLACCCHR